ncbi:hypothetical protein J4733_27525 [Klebsiella pneumoniae]|uniref:Uncharacterized protein n=1 Tax=Klebsiella pneumoniae TaxID=573 RepID=A0A939SPU4_KLEPN|nr:hypothetical protein [Klebsiella pneumoniae]
MLGEKDTTITALTPVWLDSKSRGVRDYYREDGDGTLGSGEPDARSLCH